MIFDSSSRFPVRAEQNTSEFNYNARSVVSEGRGGPKFVNDWYDKKSKKADGKMLFVIDSP